MKSIKSYKILFWAMVLCAAVISNGDEVHTKNQKANQLYKQGNYKEALKLYEDALLLSPSDSKLKMNKGSALYQLGELSKAEEAYTGALSIEDKKNLADAHYNMGNILFKSGEQLQQSGNSEASQKYKDALQHYIQSLDLRPHDTDTKWNLQLTHQRMKQLQQQQNENKDKNKDKNDKDKDKNQDQNQGNQQNQNQEENKDQQNKGENKEQEKEQEKNAQNEQQQEDQQQQEMKQQEEPSDESDMKKEEARRMIEMYADDADSLNKPVKKTGKRPDQPEQDW